MGSGTATGQAPPFRNALPSPQLLSEQLPGWRERVRWNDAGSANGWGGTLTIKDTITMTDSVLPPAQLITPLHWKRDGASEG